MDEWTDLDQAYLNIFGEHPARPSVTPLLPPRTLRAVGVASPPMNPAEFAAIRDLVRETGDTIGWDLDFITPPNPAYVGVVAGPRHTVILGPSPATDETVQAVRELLSDLESGSRFILVEPDGTPYVAARPR